MKPNYNYFEKLLEEKGVNSNQVSVHTGIATATLTHWKKGRSYPKPDKVSILANYFGVPFERFYK